MAPPFVVTWMKPKSEITARFGSVWQTAKPKAHSPKDHFFQFHAPGSSPVQPVATLALPVHCITWDQFEPLLAVLSTTGWPRLSEPAAYAMLMLVRHMATKNG